jgi:anti-anti-sigma factor
MREPPPFDVAVTSNGTAATIAVRGELDISTVGRLEQVRDELLAQSPPELLIDLSAVEFVDSSGLKVLLETHWLAQQNGWTLRISKPAASVMKVFTVSGADRHLPFLDTNQE